MHALKSRSLSDYDRLEGNVMVQCFDFVRNIFGGALQDQLFCLYPTSEPGLLECVIQCVGLNTAELVVLQLTWFASKLWGPQT